MSEVLGCLSAPTIKLPLELTTLIYASGVHCMPTVILGWLSLSAPLLTQDIVELFIIHRILTLPIYASIEYIVSIKGDLKFAIYCHSFFDPFALYSYFPTKLYSSIQAELEIVPVYGVICQFIW